MGSTLPAQMKAEKQKTNEGVIRKSLSKTQNYHQNSLLSFMGWSLTLVVLRDWQQNVSGTGKDILQSLVKS